MMNMIMKLVLWVIVIVVIAIALFLLYITITDFKPAPKEIIYQNNNCDLIKQESFSLIAWNIGYAGLGAEMDFFYDGGKKVRPSKDLAEKYMNGIKKIMTKLKPDFWLLQEVDVKSKRSHYMNEVTALDNMLTEYNTSFTINYKVPFVPVPVYAPMGQVKGGMMSMSKFEPEKVERHAYPLIASWPDRLFLLDRCFILSRFSLGQNKPELVIMNTHNSAYVYDSLLRNKELEIIKTKMLEEYEKGNYVIAGGDWNANPPNFSPSSNFNGHLFVASQVKMNADLFPDDWKWAYDPSAPTNRNNDKPYAKGENGTTFIDYFVVSPNIEVLESKTIDLNFEYSDHNPVFVRVWLK